MSQSLVDFDRKLVDLGGAVNRNERRHRQETHECQRGRVILGFFVSIVFATSNYRVLSLAKRNVFSHGIKRT